MISVDSTQNNYDNSENRSDFSVVEPVVSIEKCRVTATRFSSMANFSEYEYPCDINWEFDRNNLKFCEILGEGAFGMVKRAEAKFGDGYTWVFQLDCSKTFLCEN